MGVAVLAATGCVGCAQVTYVTSWDRSPVAHRATEEGGKLALTIQQVRVGHGKVVVNPSTTCSARASCATVAGSSSSG